MKGAIKVSTRLFLLVNRRRKHCGSVASLDQVHVVLLKARYFMKHLRDKIFKSAATATGRRPAQAAEAAQRAPVLQSSCCRPQSCT